MEMQPIGTNHAPSSYPKESAGRLMIAHVPVISPNATIADIETLLLQKTKEFSTINYVYVVDGQKKLKGVLSIKDIFRLPKHTIAKDAMNQSPVTARTHTDQERVALLALRHNVKAIPIVDKDNVLLGVVPSDTILGILHTESIEDLLKSEGVESTDPATLLISASPALHVKKRIPWLLLGLLGGIFTALLVDSFVQQLQEHLLLVAFIPAVVYMADAVGSQTQMIFIRSISIDKSLRTLPYVIREIQVGTMLALAFAALVGLSSQLIWGETLPSLVFSLSFFITIIIAMGIAIILPFMLMKLDYDPALGSGPFATIVRDILSLAIYFGVATAFLSIF